ncbi:hypothetical protein CDH04_08780 [Francisella adeliensis]|uniref:DUF4381 domain-containing protein n=2 Tax=Francisella adeliensis TaxID=2007306 RepID=A0A2Z4Y177_9GAMM|nr:hypothetical protein CDH04_08780 [Francisella adeliensis]QIW12730.1 DUF4381 domain-containing protein [Francisella adeliensis]QIW14606.1 DUF4381 domain-containing protein [Francisella adeliensis]
MGWQGMQPNNLLEQLKDIYLPQEVSSWWPLAYGWWVVFGLIIFVGVLFLIYLQIRKRQKQYIESIVDDFKASVTDTYTSKPKEVLQTISVYLKRIAIHKFPKDDIKLLYGQDWVDYLNSKTKTIMFEGIVAENLANIYRPASLSDNELEAVVVASQTWIRRVL